jgi:carboxymethylenebutenolidase
VPEPIRIPSPGEPLYEGEVGAPLVVLLHDAYGRLPWLVEYGRAMARVGFRVAIPDLFGGWATDDAGTAAGLVARAADPLALVDDVVRHERAHGSTRAASVGFGWGGALALRHAQSGDADAVVAYDATLGADEHALLPCPVLLQLSERANWPIGAGPEVFAARLGDDGTPVTTHTYTADAGFANATITSHFDANAAALAFARSARFLETYLLD